MTAIVPHGRPTLDTAAIRAGEPVSATDWWRMGALANWSSGHGGMLIPWCAIGRPIGSGSTETFHFYVGPKNRAVERVWAVNLRASALVGVSAVVTAGSASAATVYPPSTRSGRIGTFVFREPLSAKTNTAAGTTLVVQAVGGTVRVESVAMYEQTRAALALDTTDYGVDLTSLSARQPITDFANRSIRGVADGYKNLDARRAGFFHYSTPTGVAIPVTATSGAPASLFALACPVAGAIPTTTDTTTTLTIAAYAKVNADTATIRAASSQAGANGDITVTSTTFAWVTSTVSVETEDLTIADGRQGNAWEDLTWTAWRGAGATQLDIAALSVVRLTAPI
jgi:hypothetical protein